jgi:hypothetical protein
MRVVEQLQQADIHWVAVSLARPCSICGAVSGCTVLDSGAC